MTLVFDIDGTICRKPKELDYSDSEPIVERIQEINNLYERGHTIIFLTARGMGRFNNDAEKAEAEFRDLTVAQLKEWGVLYNQLFLGKPSGDYYIDDKGIRDVDYFRNDTCK